MEVKNKKYKEIFRNFKKINAPLPVIQLKINQQNKDIEKILCEMDKNYEKNKSILNKKQNSENKTRNKMFIPLSSLKDNQTNEKIDFGPVTYLTYKEKIDDDIKLHNSNDKYSYEFLRQKVLNSNNFRIGYFNTNNNNTKNILTRNKINNSEKKLNNHKKKNRLCISPYINNKIKSNKKVDTEIRNNSNNNIFKENKTEIKSNFNNEIYNIENQSNTNTEFNNMNGVTDKELKNVSLFTENNNFSNNNIKELNLFSDNNTNITKNSYLSNKNTSLTNRTNMTNYTNTHNSNYKVNNKYTITTYCDKKKPIGLKETIINNRNKTSINFNDYKDLVKYYGTKNDFLNFSNSKNKNNNQLKTFSMINEEILNIDDIAQLQEKKLNHISKKKINLKIIEKLIKKNIFSNAIIDILKNGKNSKIKLRTNLNKIKRQMAHLSLVDKIAKFSDSIPCEKLETFNQHYNQKSERIGISNKCITLKNGKIYQQSKSDSKKLSLKINQNCEEINKLAEQIMIDRYYFGEKDSKYKRLYEKIKKEKIDLSVGNI